MPIETPFKSLQNQNHNEKEEMQKRARLAEARMSKLQPAPQGMSEPHSEHDRTSPK